MDPYEQYWNTYSYCGADPINFIDPYGFSVAPIAPFFLKMSENAISLSAQAGITWGASSAASALALSMTSYSFSLMGYSNFLTNWSWSFSYNTPSLIALPTSGDVLQAIKGPAISTDMAKLIDMMPAPNVLDKVSWAKAGLSNVFSEPAGVSSPGVIDPTPAIGGGIMAMGSMVARRIAGAVASKSATQVLLPFKDAGIAKNVSSILDDIASGAAKGKEFFNKGTPLPAKKAAQYYREFTVPTTGTAGRGAQRLVVGQGGEVYFTPNHYQSFVRIR